MRNKPKYQHPEKKNLWWCYFCNQWHDVSGFDNVKGRTTPGQCKKDSLRRHRQRYQRNRSPEDREKRNVRTRRYYKKHSDTLTEKHLHYQGEGRNKITDAYTKKLLRRMGIDNRDITPETIEMKRQHVKMKRNLKQIKERIENESNRQHV